MRHGLQKRDKHSVTGFNFLTFCHKAIPDVKGSTRAFPVAFTEEIGEERKGVCGVGKIKGKGPVGS